MAVSMENMTIEPLRHEELRRALTLLSGKWKLEILWLLHHKKHRFSELRRAIPGVTQHMLTAQLRELEADGLIERRIFAEVPPRVEYSMTSATKALEPTIQSLLAWWDTYGKNARASGPRRSRPP